MVKLVRYQATVPEDMSTEVHFWQDVVQYLSNKPNMGTLLQGLIIHVYGFEYHVDQLQQNGRNIISQLVKYPSFISCTRAWLSSLPLPPEGWDLEPLLESLSCPFQLTFVEEIASKLHNLLYNVYPQIIGPDMLAHTIRLIKQVIQLPSPLEPLTPFQLQHYYLMTTLLSIYGVDLTHVTTDDASQRIAEHLTTRAKAENFPQLYPKPGSILFPSATSSFRIIDPLQEACVQIARTFADLFKEQTSINILAYESFLAKLYSQVGDEAELLPVASYNSTTQSPLAHFCANYREGINSQFRQRVDQLFISYHQPHLDPNQIVNQLCAPLPYVPGYFLENYLNQIGIISNPKSRAFLCQLVANIIQSLVPGQNFEEISDDASMGRNWSRFKLIIDKLPTQHLQSMMLGQPVPTIMPSRSLAVFLKLQLLDDQKLLATAFAFFCSYPTIFRTEQHTKIVDALATPEKIRQLLLDQDIYNLFRQPDQNNAMLVNLCFVSAEQYHAFEPESLRFIENLQPVQRSLENYQQINSTCLKLKQTGIRNSADIFAQLQQKLDLVPSPPPPQPQSSPRTVRFSTALAAVTPASPSSPESSSPRLTQADGQHQRATFDSILEEENPPPLNLDRRHSFNG